MSRGIDQKTQERRYPGIMPKDYFDKDGNVREDLFCDIAEDIVKSFQGGARVSQVRKFYDEILRRKMIIELKKDEKDKEKEFRRQLPYIKMLIAKVSYAKARGNVKENFKEFIKKNIENIHSLSEFKVFCDLFEAVLAYSKKYLKE